MLRITTIYKTAPVAIFAASLALVAPANALDKRAVSEVAHAYNAASESRDASVFGSAALRPHIEVQQEDGSSQPLVPVTAPADPASGVRFGQGTEAIRLFPDTDAASSEKTEARDGVSVYAGSDGVSTVVEPSLAGARVSTVALRDSGSDQQTFRYRLQLPRGHALRANADGGVDVVGPGGRVSARIAAPWAKDADGASLPTAYTIDGSTLIQTVDTTAATYPVVADPEVEILWIKVLGINTIPHGIKVWFSRGETEFFYDHLPAAAPPTGVAARICLELKKLPKVAKAFGKFVAIAVDLACGVVAGQYLADLAINLKQAHEARNCLTLESSISITDTQLFDFNNGGGSFCKE